MRSLLTGLERAHVFRPREYAGQVEVQVGEPATRRWPTRICEGFEMSLLIGPTHEATIHGRKTETPGKLTFVQLPGTVWSAKRAVGAFLSLELSPELFARFVADLPRRPSLPGPSQVVLPGLLDAFWRTHKVFRSQSDATTRTETLVRLVAMVLESLSGKELPAPTVSDGVTRAREAIHDCPHEAPTIDRLAAEAAMSPIEFVRAFRRQYGVGPAEYRRALRMARGRRMCLAGRATADIASELGFSSATAFRRSFVASAGIDPERYAQQIASGPR